MNAKPTLETALPTPFGWVFQTQHELDLKTMLAFQSQLISLARACGTSKAPVEAAASVEAVSELLVPLRAA